MIVMLTKALLATALSAEAFRQLQATGYYPQRGYVGILLTPYFGLLAATSVICGVLYACGQGASLHIAIYVAAAFISVAVKRKTPLKFTKRIGRMMTVCFALNFVLVCLRLPVAILLPMVAIASWCVCLPVDQKIARHYLAKASQKLRSCGATVIAVTGSYGKTSVKSMLCSLLDGAVCAEGSCNTPLGIATFLNKTDLTDVKYVVLEFGARKMNDITELCDLYKPFCGVVTGVCEQHLKTFGSLDNIIRTKQELLCNLPHDGFCVLNSADETVRGWIGIGNCQKILSQSNVRVERKLTSLLGAELSVDGVYDVKLPQICGYVADTFAMCAEVCLRLGQPIGKTVANAVKVRAAPHRAECMHNGRFFIVDDSYNASIQGIRSICVTLSEVKKTKVAITQGIVECGVKSKQLNVECGELLGKTFDVVVVTGKNKRYLLEGLSRTQCKTLVARSLSDATNVAVKHVDADGVLYFQNDLPDTVGL